MAEDARPEAPMWALHVRANGPTRRPPHKFDLNGTTPDSTTHFNTRTIAGMGVNELALSFVLNVVSKLPRNIRETIVPDMLIPPIANSPDKVQLTSLGHVYFEHPDLEQFDSFAIDFGFVVERREEGRVFYRGYGEHPFIYVASQSPGNRPHFKGPAFVAKSQEEFDKAKAIPGAQLGSLDDAPGGGQIVTFERADDTFFHVVFGQKMRDIDTTHTPSATHESLGPANTPSQKPRRG
jgi:hypothetical protein